MSEMDPLAVLLRPNQTHAMQTHALKYLVQKRFELPETEPVFIAEISCGKINCPDLETVVAMFVDGKREEFRLAKAVKNVTGSDIVSLASASTVQGESQ